MIEIFIGTISGIVSGLGMGGGTILILFLSLFLDIEQHIAQATNVIFFVPTAITAILVNLKQKNINLKIGLPICLWGVIGAFVGAIISMQMNMKTLRKFFGLFIILIAIYQTYMYIKGRKRHTSIK